jgi:uncharacterized protein (TIGR00369 family)
MTSVASPALPIDNPFLEWMGVTLHAWSPGYAEMRLPCSGELSNRTSRVHGGVLCTLLDSVSGYSGLYAPPGEPALRALTLSLTTNFLDAADGDVLTAKGYVVRKGRSVFFARAEVWLDETRLLATSVGTFKYLRPA